jgi:glycosyltransferase domain-containing protein
MTIFLTQFNTHCLQVKLVHRMDLSSITLVILSHNRQHCLKSTLNFYESTNLNILVLDNSPEPLSKNSVPKNCRYINVDAPFAKRSALAADLITTPYTIIGADDEIYIPPSLEKMKNFLDYNADYVAVGGYAMAVWEYGPTIAATWAYKKTYGYHNSSPEPLERIRYHTGGGINPYTSFFTCNLTRTWAAQECLSMYGRAPVLATDAISVITICGAGKSKYLDLVYWIRNWNQSPRSHSGWDRRISLHEWWQLDKNNQARTNFSIDLRHVYKKYANTEAGFAQAWGMILQSDQVLQRHISLLKGKVRTFNEIPIIKTFKYQIKRLMRPKALPPTVLDLTAEMSALRIFAPENEILRATSIVSNILPYESW